MKKLLTIAACLTVTALLQSQTTIFVKPDGTGDGTSWANACNLENAVVSAPLNDRTEIWVQKGTYYPSKMLVISDSVKIYGGFAGVETALSQRNFSANPTIVNGQQKIGSIFRLENFAEINGFTIQNGNAFGNPHKNGGGVWADDNAVIENCIIQNNAAIADGGGVYAKGNLNLLNSTIENNTASNGADLYGNCITQVLLPIIISHPDATEKSPAKGGSFPALSVSATSTLLLSYQWFSNTTASNIGGNNLGSANGAQTTTYTPQGTTVGTLYYYCEITNADGTTKSKVSGAHIVTTPIIVAPNCNGGTFDFGTVSFETSKEYPITGTVNGETLTQTWSDAVTGTNCNKTVFDGGGNYYDDETGSMVNREYIVDCRNNPDYRGDFFSWCAVTRFADVLCPTPWRVPTMEDFVNLDKALGGTGENRYNLGSHDAILLKYISSWGGIYGGGCNHVGTLFNRSSDAFYWSQSGVSTGYYGYNLHLISRGSISPQLRYDRSTGFPLRCVK